LPNVSSKNQKKGNTVNTIVSKQQINMGIRDNSIDIIIETVGYSGNRMSQNILVAKPVAFINVFPMFIINYFKDMLSYTYSCQELSSSLFT
jgi:hypothetical protein